MSAKFDPTQFFGRAENVALNVQASDVFGLLTRSLDLPGAWAALVTREAGDCVLVPPGKEVSRAGAEDIMFVRVSPLAVTLELDGLASRDGYHCRATVDVRVSVPPELGDLESFHRQVLGSCRVVQVDTLARHLEPAVRTGLVQFCARHDGKDLTSTVQADAIKGAVVEALKAPCFSGGLAVDGEPTVRIDSSALRSVRDAEQEMARRKAEHDASRGLTEALEKARDEHLDHLANLLGRLKTLATDSPDVELPALLRTFTERQRGELYEALFATEVVRRPTRWIVAATGTEVLFFDPKDPSSVARRVPISGTVGAVRSVQVMPSDDGKAVLWLGAATGIYRLPLVAGEPDITLSVPGNPGVRGGFNAVAVRGARAFASHSELGLYEWSVEQPEKATPLLHSMTQEATTVRAVCTYANSVYCAVDDRIVSLSLDCTRDVPNQVFTGSDSTITAVCPTRTGLYAGNSRGEVLRWPARRESPPETVFRGSGRAVESVWHTTTQGVARLIFSDTSLCVRAQVLGDSFICRYEAGGQTLRRVEVADDLVVATNDLRDRLFCWTPGKPTNPKVTIPISRIDQQSVQDFCLV